MTDTCHICGNSHLELFEKYTRFHRVTSDSKPWPPGGSLILCHSCGCVQKLTDLAWHGEIESIYNAYSIYFQGAGTEQEVFDMVSGNASSRSSRILECVSRFVKIPATGKLLDIGCGNGALLRRFGEKYPEWMLFGIELNDKYQREVETIPHVRTMYVNSQPDVIKETFNCITMIHVLEHIIHPGKYLEKILTLLAHDGILIIEVPNFEKNPYDLLIADHCTHFGNAALQSLLLRSGFEVIFSSTTCVTKEITVVARKGSHLTQKYHISIVQDSSEIVSRCIDFLESNIRDARVYAETRKFGIFGTSIAATWLFSELPESVHFFIDEDVNRIGKIYLGRPVYDLTSAPSDSLIFLPFCPPQARDLKERLEKQNGALELAFSFSD